MTLSTPYIDSHAHLTSEELYPRASEILTRAKQAGISSIINICTDPTNLTQAINLKTQYPWIYNAAATHPHDAGTIHSEFFKLVKTHAIAGDLIAIGETGLDYHYNNSDRPSQHAALREHFHLALECSLPIIIHCREAFTDFFSILDADYTRNGVHAPGVLHCFTGTTAEAEETLKRGFYLSISGIVTFKKSEELRQIAKITPLDRLLIETDAPYLAPQSHRGKTNEPSFVIETASAIAYAKGISIEEVAYATTENAKRLFKLGIP